MSGNANDNWVVPMSNAHLVIEWDPIHSGRNKYEGTDVDRWNPLTDDGDAFRLAVQLHMSISVNSHYVTVTIKSTGASYKVALGDDDEANRLATRLAIVQAAAHEDRANAR